jgi:hypothetical protein
LEVERWDINRLLTRAALLWAIRGTKVEKMPDLG